MHPDRMRRILSEVRAGQLTIEAALEALRFLPFESLVDLRLDHHRHLRCGFPEVVLGERKSDQQVLDAARSLAASGSPLLVTRLREETGRKLAAAHPGGVWNARARTFRLDGETPPAPAGRVGVLCAGTSDLPVAEEAAETARSMGAGVELHADVGVAGLHRLSDLGDLLHQAGALVVAAGMEGALASVVGGLTDRPVIAVPTSVGYGASFQGVAALLAMLNSCAAGVVVVNIDNGFAAGYAAALISRGRPPAAESGRTP
ncbi:MAG: nickel pincer cofactor biosynthesis protein LarB [Candidatus Eisenbacteria bacterium]|nr:nickel pincer cofactor biosynthesis protein LarB [Candidatus Eisenbacteria bacterium]